MKNKGLDALKTSARSFEETLEGSKSDEELKQRSYNVFQESKSTLDYSMNHLKQEAFPETGKTNIFFPYLQDTKEKLEKKFEDMGFQGLSQKYPEVIDFVLDKTKPAWVKKFIAIRNTKVSSCF